ncbi:MAG: hypothetical protein J7647_23250 [Cyanobacteria bacterium SBLK]|nr:hypothetical protein [Cyanobacteria bacterium SBLK]
MIQHDQFTYYLYFLVYDIGETSCLKSIDWLRLKVARTSGLLNEEEKQIIDRILHAVEYERIVIVERSTPLAKPLSYQSYKMLCQNQPAEYFCQLFNRLVETNALSETDFQMLQDARESCNLNFEEEQIVKRIFYSIKRGRIKLVKTREVSPQNL